MNIKIENLTLSYGSSVAVRDLSLEIQQGEALVLLGQSGCGKTSTMRCVAGLETPDSGRITVGGNVLFDSERGINVASHKRNIGMVFQSYAIWPHLTVFENVAFPLQMKRVAKANIAPRVHEALAVVGLDGFADRGASMLSGGQMQRVALARSLVMEPSVMLLDEPLSNLDARLRHRLRQDLRELQHSLGLTSVYVTHDQEEALALADHIAMMQFGRIVQIGSPDEIYGRPLSASIADFLGVANILPATRVDATTVELQGTQIKLEVEPFSPHDELRACIRAEDVLFDADIPHESPNTVEGVVVSREFLGATATFKLRLGEDVELQVLGTKLQTSRIREGETMRVYLPKHAVQVLPLEVTDANVRAATV
ncbi:ABC transporter ATP-binding protein [Leucobacter sp. UCMA 4100]|uniref:ABC transporter ATP-binding protein n=1 Tax=Leucobacter sp. UCMA 4100 TaxID=2810534 RepID=UPI0022EA5238|nr:ABC transporter ATP-binding protein [Leucobacter sp. UCMA 4100]MDA3146619.1 ABC transporter ATP-binding protein [Leucobacter sp. UCMA 4100]